MFNCCNEEPPDAVVAEIQVISAPSATMGENSAPAAEPSAEAQSSSEPVEAAAAEPEPKAVEPETAKATAKVAKTFQVTINNDLGDIGLHFYFIESNLIVAGGIGGPLEDWNKNQSESSSRVRIFDRIFEVNGAAGTKAELAAKLKEKGEMTISLEHPRQLEVGLEKKGQLVGLEMSASSGVTGAVVTSIQDGLIKQFNAVAPVDKQIKVNDIAVKVDNEQLKGEDIIKKVGELENFKLRILSYSA